VKASRPRDADRRRRRGHWHGAFWMTGRRKHSVLPEPVPVVTTSGDGAEPSRRLMASDWWRKAVLLLERAATAQASAGSSGSWFQDWPRGRDGELVE